MLEEEAVVVATGVGEVWVETLRSSTCSACSAKAGCGTAALAKVLGQRRTRIRVLNDLELNAGDRVVLGLAESALMRGSLLLYATPLAGLLTGALIGEWMAAQLLHTSNEGASILTGIAGLIAALVWVRRRALAMRGDARYQPRVLRRVQSLSTHGMVGALPRSLPG